MLHNIQFGKNLTVFPGNRVSKQVNSAIKLPSKTLTDIYNGHSVPPGLVSWVQYMKEQKSRYFISAGLETDVYGSAGQLLMNNSSS
jgi:hypothetical protein